MSNSRRFHEDSRLSENFTEQGLQSLTGEGSRQWARYVVKELVDNSLEAAEGYASTPAVDIQIETTGTPTKVSRVVVSDNGPGIEEDDIATIFEDVGAFAGSKRHYCLPSRGNQGNALMTILGIQYLSHQPLVVETNGTRHTITVTEDAITSEHNIERETEPCDVDGTRIMVDFHSGYYCRFQPVKDTIGAFVALNPHVEWTVGIDDLETTFDATEDSSVEQFTLSKKATTGKALWFSGDDFKERLKADARADPSLTVDDIVTEFAKLTSKGDDVFDGIEEYRTQSIDTFLREQSDDAIQTLYRRMVAETSTYSDRTLDSTLGSVGNDLTHSLYNYLRFTGEYDGVKRLARNLSDYSDDISKPPDMTVYYSDGAVVESDDSEKAIPFNFELTAIPKASEDARTTIEFGINQSVSYSAPRVSVKFTDTNDEQSFYGIASAFDGTLKYDYHIVTNLTCPNLDFQDKGKQSFSTEPFEAVVSDVVGTAISKIQRDIRPRLNDLRTVDDSPDKRKLTNKAPRGFISDVVEEHFQQAYDKATEGGKYTIEMRQLYYVMRPMFYDVAERRGYEYASGATVDNPKPLELDYDYFSQLVADYETEQLGQRVVHRDNRGFFVEPHSNKRIDLQTVDVEQYEPDLDKFDTLLFVEKTGFFKLIHQDFELTKKYDIGLINSKGYSTIAGRKLIEKVQQRGDVDLLTLTDLDINGLGIADDATEADDLSVVNEFDATRIGITLSDVEEYDLPVESRNYTDKQITQLTNRVESGTIGAEVGAFLTDEGGQAVEINALTPAELRTYLTTKFEEYGVEKVKPDEEDIDTPDVPNVSDVREEAVNEGIGEFVRKQAYNELEELATWDEILPETEAAQELDSMETDTQAMWGKVMEELAEWPTDNWEDRNEKLIDDIDSEVEEKREKAEAEWIEAVQDYLKDNVTVEVRIQD